MIAKHMTAGSVGYHVATVLAEPGAATEHERQAGETALRWAGCGCADFGLGGPVSMSAYLSMFHPEGARHPATGDLLASSRRPGVELVNRCPKSMAVVGACGRTADMVAVLEADTDTQLSWLDTVTMETGGRRGKAGAVRCGTSGLTMAVTRHLTSRTGDPYAHHHVLVANVVTLADGHGTRALDARGFYKALTAAGQHGRTAGAVMAEHLGYRTETVDDRRGRPSMWRVAGVPPVLEDLFSKRTAQLAEAVADAQQEDPDRWVSRAILVNTTRASNGPKDPDMDMLRARWREEMTAAGWPPEAVLAAVDEAAQSRGAA